MSKHAAPNAQSPTLEKALSPMHFLITIGGLDVECLALNDLVLEAKGRPMATHDDNAGHRRELSAT